MSDFMDKSYPLLLRGARGYDLSTELLPKITLICLSLLMQKNDKPMKNSLLSFLLLPNLSLFFRLPTLRGR